MLKKLKQLLSKPKDQWDEPRILPKGIAEFEKWVSDVITISGLPDNKSTRHLAATFILSTPPSVARLPIRHVSDQLVKAAAYQVALQVAKDTDPKKVTDEQSKVTEITAKMVPKA